MNKKFGLILLLIVNLILLNQLSGQFTPYDDLPDLDKLEKPAYSVEFPEWGKMLYQYPVNYIEVSNIYKESPIETKGKSPILRYFKKWSRALAPFSDNNGEIIVPTLDEIKSIVNPNHNDHSNESLSKRTANSWSFVGPKVTHWLNESGSSTPPKSCPWQVNIYSFDISKTDHNVIYVGTETGFVNKSIDGGHTWTLITQSYDLGGAATAVAVHPTNSDIVYVSAGKQMHLTTDGGLTWKKLLTNTLFGASKMKINQLDPNIILAASGDGLFVTIDGGATWVRKFSSPTYDVDYKADDFTQSFALLKEGTGYSMVSSLDNSVTFSKSMNFPTSYQESSGGVIATTLDNSNAIFATLLTNGNVPIILKGTNTNSGWNWLEIAKGNSNHLGMNNGQGYYDLDMEVSPTDENYFLVATTTLYKTANGGTSFTAVGGYTGNFSIHPDIQDIVILDNENVWVATDGGLNFTSDFFTLQSNHRVAIDGIVGSDFWGFDQGWNEDIIVGGRYHNGNTAIADFYNEKALRMGGAESPTGWVIQGKSRHVAFDDLGNGWILPKTAESQPEGRFLFTKFPNMEEYGGRRGNLVHHPNYSGELYLGEGNSFWKSIDFGENWLLLNNFGAQVRYLQIGYNDPSVLYADIVGKGFYKSEDGGLTWVSKPSLTKSPNGSAYWNGKLNFAVSPSNANHIYACLQNGTWSQDKGKIMESIDGGDSWVDITYGLDTYMKSIVVQPNSNGSDLIYLFTNSILGTDANVYILNTGDVQWEYYNVDYPKGMDVNIALPFYRDDKIRVAGNGGVWEAPLVDVTYAPIITPWTDKAIVDCILDTITLDDHSMINHEGVTWQWKVFPDPLWSDNLSMRNPRLVLGAIGTYEVSLTVSKNGVSYTTTIPNMITAKACPSIETCDNPAILPKSNWQLISADSEEINYPGFASMAFDNDIETIWHTRWSTGSDPYPHELVIDLGEDYKAYEFIYQARTDGENGRIKNYQLYFSKDQDDWGLPVDEGNFINTAAPQKVNFQEGVEGRYFKLVALSEVNGNSWASAAELSFVGCYLDVSSDNLIDVLAYNAYPMPVQNELNVDFPYDGSFEYLCYNMEGSLISKGSLQTHNGSLFFDTTNYNAGSYILKLITKDNNSYSIKFIKM